MRSVDARSGGHRVSPRELDEDDVRNRPPRRSTRPRSKDRPAHADAAVGFVVGVDRGRITCVLGDPHDDRQPGDQPALVTAVKARELGRKGVVIGDQVSLVGDVSGADDTLARVVRVSDRVTSLRRTADDTDPVERVIVCNADQLAIVTALADPPPRMGMIDRCLVAAFDAQLDPLLVLTKSDLADPSSLLEAYAALDVPFVVTHRGGSIGELNERLHDRLTVMVGHSGVGKSTLVNELVPDAHRSIGVVNAVTGRGRHTSTSTVALPLPHGGWVIDTPGVRSFGLAHVDLSRVIRAFPELEDGTEECPRGCSHDETECGLDAWVASGRAGSGGAARLASLRRLLSSRHSGDGGDSATNDPSND